MTELINSQKAVDIITLANELDPAYKEIESIGGVAYLASSPRVCRAAR
jgi:replicative DNA helicase